MLLEEKKLLLSFNHGQTVPLAPGQLRSSCTSFGYFFPTSAFAPFTNETLGHFDAVMRDMVERNPTPEGNHSSLPPIMTYFGQFVDHDITATAADDDLSPLPSIVEDFEPQPRGDVVERILNARTGQFDLDSLYGSQEPNEHPILEKLRGLLRFPGDRAMMWIGTYGDPSNRVEFPKHDDGGDLLRLGRLLDSGAFTVEDLHNLPETHIDLYFHKATDANGDRIINRARAIIGDARNDENLFIAQLHLAFLRFHNRVVQEWPQPRVAGDEDEVYAWAQMQVRRFYQWLVIHAWLPTICDPKVVRSILSEGPVLYDHFLEGCGWTQGHPMPMPLEFATAAFRFGHSTVRGTYDWNGNFNAASFRLMFLFTGNVPLDPATGQAPLAGTGDKLPGNWGADWDRLVHPISDKVNRSARQIDTDLALPLSDMANEGDNAVSRNLIARNLRRGAMQNLTTAQEAIKRLKELGIEVPSLMKAQIASGETGSEIKAGGFDAHTPLWFYTLKEAEVLGAGQRLGPFGSHLVAGTILGLILRGPNSVWSTAGSVEGRWHPVDGPRVSGQLVDSFPALMRAALLMENPDFQP